MSGKKSGGGRPQGKMPTPEQILRRYGRVTGIPSLVPKGASKYRSAFSAGGICMDQFTVMQMWQSPGSEGGLQFEVAESPIGQYNPASGKWLLHPEYVLREERRALERVAHGLGTKSLQKANVERVQRGASTIDVFHPYTRKVRARLDAMLGPLKLLERPAIRDAMDQPNSPALDIDWSTFAYPVMETLLSKEEAVEAVGVNDTITTPYIRIAEASNFTLRVAGVKVENEDAPGHSFRDTRSVILANRVIEGKSRRWVPDLP